MFPRRYYFFAACCQVCNIARVVARRDFNLLQPDKKFFLKLIEASCCKCCYECRVSTDCWTPSCDEDYYIIMVSGRCLVKVFCLSCFLRHSPQPVCLASCLCLATSRAVSQSRVILLIIWPSSREDVIFAQFPGQLGS